MPLLNIKLALFKLLSVQIRSRDYGWRRAVVEIFYVKVSEKPLSPASSFHHHTQFGSHCLRLSVL
jgi:hypothetical protein